MKNSDRLKGQEQTHSVQLWANTPKIYAGFLSKRIQKTGVMATLLFIWLISTINIQAQTLDEVKKLIQSENYSQAIQVTNKLLSQNTKDGRNFYYKGLAYYKLAGEEGTTDANKTTYMNQAKVAFDGAMSRNRKDPYAYLGKALHLIGSDKYEEAKKEITTGLEFGAKDVEWLVKASEVYIEAFQFEQGKGKGKGNATRKSDAMSQATTILTKATVVADKDPNVYIALGDVYLTQNIEESAESNYKKALGFAPNNIDARYALSKVLMRQKKYTEAREEINKVKQADPKFANAYRDLADLYYKINQFPAALKEAQEWKNLIGNDKRANARYATLLYLTNNFKEAVPALAQINKDSSSYVLKRIYGYSLVETKQYKEAQAVMDEYFKMAPANMYVYKDYVYYGTILENTDRKDEAIQQYQKAMDSDPSLWELNKNIYTIYKDKKDWANASKYLELFMNKQTENKQANLLIDMYMLGWMNFYQLNNIDKAGKVIDELMTKKENFIEGLYLSANIKAQKDTTGKTAYPVYEKLVKEIHLQKQEDKKKKELKEAYIFMCGFIHIELKDNPRSLMYCQKALELDPAAKTAKDISAYLVGQKITPKDWNAELSK